MVSSFQFLIHRKKSFLSILWSAMLPVSSAQAIDCINAAARCFYVNPYIIKSIIWRESKNVANIKVKNKNNTYDYGVMQINSIHLKKFNKMGISENDLVNNACLNVFSGTYLLSNIIRNRGYSWDSIGFYHSATASYHDGYIKNLIDLIVHHRDTLDKINIISTSDYSDKFACH